MKYLDTGSRDADSALGTWLNEVGSDGDTDELRLQTGYFGIDGLGGLRPLIERLARADGLFTAIIGSNAGSTSAPDVEALRALAGAPRASARLGVASFQGGALFHPKVIHATRRDCSMTAYVGSANLTRNGVSGLNIESGLRLDSREGDDVRTLIQIRTAIDWWFTEDRSGIRAVTDAQSVNDLMTGGILSASRPSSNTQGTESANHINQSPSLQPLIPLAHIATPSTMIYPDPPTSEAPGPGEALAMISVVDSYQKRLTLSDAQRKVSGNQRGSITLTKAGYPIDFRTFFRHDFFGGANWQQSRTHTGQPRDIALLPVAVQFKGLNLGTQVMEVSYAPNRQSNQDNYTSLIHLGPLAPYFASTDVTGWWMRIEKRTNGSYALEIEPGVPS